MILELTIPKIIQIAFAFIMIFAMGLKMDVSEETRKAARYIWGISLAIVWIFIVVGV